MIKKTMAAAELLAVVILITLSVVVLLQVLLRNFFETGFVWGEEASRFLLLSMVLIAAPVVLNDDGHVTFDLLCSRLTPRGKAIQKIAISLSITGFYVVYIVSHLQLMKNSGNVLSPSLRIPNRLFFSAGLIGAILGILSGIGKVIVALRGEDK